MKSTLIRRLGIASTLVVACMGCQALHEQTGDGGYPPYGQDQATADNGGDRSQPPYPHLPTLHPVPTHPVFLLPGPDGMLALPPEITAPKTGAAPSVAARQIQSVPPTLAVAPEPLNSNRPDQVAHSAPRYAPDNDAQSWLFQPNGIVPVDPNSQARRRSDEEGQQIRR
jgi:hypothetical protein